MALLSPLSPEQRTTFLVVSVPQRALRRLVGRLGTAPTGTRVDALSVWDLAWTLVDYYETDQEVAGEVDRALRKEIGPSPLAGAVAADGGAKGVTDLVLSSRDPLHDLAWALLSEAQDAGPLAAELVQAIIVEYDEAEARAKEEEEAAAANPEAEPEPPDPEEVERRIEKETAQARRGRERALKRIDDMKGRLVELESGLAEARRELRAARTASADLETERARLESEREALKTRLQTGTAAEVARLTALLEDQKRTMRSVEEDLAESRDAEAALAMRLRALEERRPPQDASSQDADQDGARTESATWSLPVFTDEFYDSIKSWDKKVLHIAFDKVVRLAEDWRHPSLRAIPLEGLAGHYRIRIASDVRLIYRLLDGGRIEILSLIDREDLQRYIRTAKTR